MQNPKDLPVSQFRQSFRVLYLSIHIKKGGCRFPGQNEKVYDVIITSGYEQTFFSLLIFNK